MVSRMGFGERIICFGLSVMLNKMGFLGGEDVLFFSAVMVSKGGLA